MRRQNAEAAELVAQGAEPDAAKRSELLDLCMTCWRQAQFLRRWPGIPARARGLFLPIDQSVRTLLG